MHRREISAKVDCKLLGERKKGELSTRGGIQSKILVKEEEGVGRERSPFR